jgi:toluene monooxygenase system ferredoxin subunit
MDGELVCPADDLWEGEMVFHTLADGIDVVVLNVGGRLVAYQGRCPHQDTTFEDAVFDGDVLVCTAHLWEFDAATGDGLNPTNTRLCEFPVEIRDGGVYVTVPCGEMKGRRVDVER